MKTFRRLLALGLAACLVFAGNNAWAHRPRVGVGVVVGPVFAPAPIWYPSPWYYPPPVVVVPAPPPAPPPVYVEQQPAPANAEPAAQAYWYFCASAKGYYPYVKTCPEAWERVLPVPESEAGKP